MHFCFSFCVSVLGFGEDPRSFVILFALRFLWFCGLDRYELEIEDCGGPPPLPLQVGHRCCRSDAVAAVVAVAKHTESHYFNRVGWLLAVGAGDNNQSVST